MATFMLQEKNLKKILWAKVVNTTVYLLNKSSTKVVPNQTSIEAWSSRKPWTGYLKVSNCVCYIYVLFQKRTKFEEKTEKKIFLGYSTLSKGYRIYDLETKNLITNRDAIFDEHAIWNWEREQLTKPSITFLEENSADNQNNTEEEGETPQLTEGKISSHQNQCLGGWHF